MTGPCAAIDGDASCPIRVDLFHGGVAPAPASALVTCRPVVGTGAPERGCRSYRDHSQ